MRKNRLVDSVSVKRWSAVAAVALVMTTAGCASSDEGVPSRSAPGTNTPGINGMPMAGSPAIGAPMVDPATGMVTPGVTGTAPAGGAMPCSIATTVKASCGTCHGAVPIGGAPMSLLSLADFQRDYLVNTTTELKGTTMKMHQLVKIRLNREMNTKPMPQGAPLAAASLTEMNTWLAGGALAGAACAPPGGDPVMMGGTGGSGAMDPVIGDGSECAADPTLFEKLVAKDGETCYEFRTHGASSPTDKSKFNVPAGETYNQWYFAIPWPTGSVQTRTGADFDNLKVLHHWLGFTSTSGNAPGTVSPNVTGTTLGESSELWGGWAVGGCAIVSPPDVGVRLPDTGKIMIQWHHNNSTGVPQPDSSAVQVCVVPKAMRKFTAGMTFLGTENFNGPLGMPAGMKSEFGGTCTNDSAGPITIFGFSPHMHLLGVNMKSVVVRKAGGTPETVFDKPFQFDHQVNYMIKPNIVLQPGDKITSTCTFNNTTAANVAFGQPTKSEMCYQFALAYPYNELNNGVLSLIGATNTCW